MGRKKIDGARTRDPLTSHEAASEKGARARTSHAIESLAWQAGATGITINECAARMPEHKAWSISPLFAPLVRKGVLVRRIIGFLKPCRRWPHGKVILETRIDPETKKRCIVHYHHAFAQNKSVESDHSSTPTQPYDAVAENVPERAQR